jgi:hypothetical protein
MARSLRLLPLLLVALGLTQAPRTARACGAFFPAVTQGNAAIDAERTLIVWGADEIAIHAQIAAETTATDYTWVLPVPANPQLSLGDAAIFDGLDALTEPTITLLADSADGGGTGCCVLGGSDRAGGAGNLGGQGGVTLFEGGTLGSYEYQILSGTAGGQIADWLTSNGFAVPEGAAQAFQPYAAGGMRFVAAKVSRSASAAPLQALEPLVITFPRPVGAEFVYPLGLGKLSAAGFVPVLLYVLADQRQRVANYGSTDLQQVATEMRRQRDSVGDAEYGTAVDALTAEAGGRLFVTEFARDLSALPAEQVPAALAAAVAGQTPYLTRLFARTPAASLEDTVITFATAAPEVLPAATAQAPARPGAPLTAWAPAWALFAALAALVLGLHRR